MTKRERDTTRCRDCGRQWESLTQAHCTRCHLQFSGPTAFDEHLTDTGRGQPPRCRTAQELLTGKPPAPTGRLKRILAPRPERYGDVWRYAEHKPRSLTT
jgi:NAD-dependent SIR2 family protein deacetylase